MTPEQAPSMIAALRVALPTAKYIDGLRRGYVLLDVTAQRLRADWYHAATVLERSSIQRLAASFVCESGSAHLASA
jgi:alkaline phosphatase D